MNIGRSQRMGECKNCLKVISDNFCFGHILYSTFGKAQNTCAKCGECYNRNCQEQWRG